MTEEKIMREKQNKIDMCNGPLAGKMIAFALPLMLSGVLQLLFNAVDIMVVGKWISSEALAAVGSTGTMIILLTSIFMGLSVGTNILTARYYGAGNEKQLHDIVHTSMALGIVCGIIMAVIGIAASETLLKGMGTPEEILDMAVLYMRIYFLGVPVTMIYNMGAAVLRAGGDTRRPMYFLLLAGVANAGLNIFFIVVCHLGVAGVALATVLSQTMAMLCLLWTLCRSDDSIHLKLRDIRLNGDEAKKILGIGIPASLQTVLFAFSNVLIQSSINSFGTAVMAGSAAAANLEGFVTTAMNSFHQTSMNFTSQNYGAGKVDRIKKVMILALVFDFIAGLILGNAVYLFGDRLLGIYLDDARSIEYGMVRLKYTCILYFLLGTIDIFVGVMRGMGRVIPPMIISLVGVCGFRILWLYTVFQKYHTIDVLFLSYPVSWGITMLAQMLLTWYVWKRAIGKNKNITAEN